MLVLQIAPGGQAPGGAILWATADAQVKKIAQPKTIPLLTIGFTPNTKDVSLWKGIGRIRR
jgi:hypothetical protein